MGEIGFQAEQKLSGSADFPASAGGDDESDADRVLGHGTSSTIDCLVSVTLSMDLTQPAFSSLRKLCG
jgi:hypothetical protein